MRPAGRECTGHTLHRHPSPRDVLPDGTRSVRAYGGRLLLGEPGPDIGKWLVANGFALDWPQYSKGQYPEEQRGARRPAAESGAVASLSPGSIAPVVDRAL